MWRRGFGKLDKRHFSLAQESAVKENGFKKILVANRGEIACRIQKTAQKIGIRTVAVYSEADRYSQHKLMADESYCIGPAPATESYLLGDKILDIAKQCGAEAIHPGYGFLSENANFAKSCASSNIAFIGPPVEAIEAMGSKSASKDIMINANVPVTPGYHEEDQSLDTLKHEADKIKYPVLIKAVLGGGGKGMRIVDTKEEFEEALDACKREALTSFGDDRVLIEKYLRQPRHVELQIFGDTHGNVVHLFERDCSVQRRHQKVLEEAPAPGMSEELRKKMGDAAVAAAKAVGYVGAGTVEFMLDVDNSFYFMEMNTRLQVEHPVTEMITKKDLVQLQLMVAAGEPLPFQQQDLKIHGHAIEARIYAENPYNDFLPGTGKLVHLKTPQESDSVRVDTGVIQDDQVSIFYDPMIAKLIVHAEDRTTAINRLVDSLKKYQIAGLTTNIEFLARTASHPGFMNGGVDTSFLGVHGEALTKPFGDVPDHGVAVGAVSLLIGEKRAMGTSDSVWCQDDVLNFRSAATTSRNFQLKDADRNIDVRITSSDTGYAVSIDDNSPIYVSGSMNADGRYTFYVNQTKYEGNAAFLSNAVQVYPDDGTLRYDYSLVVPSLSYAPSGSGDGASSNASIITPMPGKVIKVLVKPGDSIVADQKLMILEAMKMEHVIRASGDGIVDEVNVEALDFVEDGSVLITFE